MYTVPVQVNMISRRVLLAAAVPWLTWAKVKTPASFGLELYSFRARAEKDLPATLAAVRRFGIREVEVSGLYGHTAREFRQLLNKNGLHATSCMAEYDRLEHAGQTVAADARALGAEYVVCSTLPHSQKFLSVDDCDRAAPKLNAWGKQLAEAGLRLCYHTHGTEFQRLSDGTVFDALAERLDARYANFEMDIFWIVFGRQDPATLLRRYPGRFPLMHVKDIRKGTVLGRTPADVEEADSVVLGQGIVDIRSALQAAAETGVKHYYIEDEAVDAAAQLPGSLRFLKSLRY